MLFWLLCGLFSQQQSGICMRYCYFQPNSMQISLPVILTNLLKCQIQRKVSPTYELRSSDNEIAIWTVDYALPLFLVNVWKSQTEGHQDQNSKLSKNQATILLLHSPSYREPRAHVILVSHKSSKRFKTMLKHHKVQLYPVFFSTTWAMSTKWLRNLTPDQEKNYHNWSLCPTLQIIFCFDLKTISAS